jgi:DNA-binding GntR family transcriptional regulator
MAVLSSLKVEKRLLGRQAAEAIRSSIITGVLPPSERLLEVQLAKQLEVSRGTVRSALAQLAHEGLVRQVAFTKWEVSGTSAADAWELYTLRSVLEGFAARTAAERATPEERKALEAIGLSLVETVRAQLFEETTELDFQLHQQIVTMARHGRLADQHRVILQQVRFHMVQADFLPRDYDQFVEEHEALVKAVVGGHAELAESLARSHNDTEVALLSKALT